METPKEVSHGSDRDRALPSECGSRRDGVRDRESGVADDGERVVVVHWDTTADADASMQKFMTDPLVPNSSLQNFPFWFRHWSAGVRGSMTSQCSVILPSSTRIRS